MMSPREGIFKQLLCCSVVLYYMFRRKSLVLICKMYFDSTSGFLVMYLSFGPVEGKVYLGL